jgi:hypothetical protein
MRQTLRLDGANAEPDQIRNRCASEADHARGIRSDPGRPFDLGRIAERRASGASCPLLA